MDCLPEREMALIARLQGTEVHEWPASQRARLTSTLQQKEEELRSLRKGSRVTIGDIPEDVQLDKEGVLELVGGALRASEGQMVESLKREASLLSDILQLKLQQSALTTGRLHTPATSSKGSINRRSDTPAKENKQTAKTKSREKSVNPP
ncbi:hypothetical protein INR49_012159 [Caranx melampygus]|nr:hypothetical protein INR49_012159 [Caranx melampygus]